jgi:hypothetical protein
MRKMAVLQGKLLFEVSLKEDTLEKLLDIAKKINRYNRINPRILDNISLNLAYS